MTTGTKIALFYSKRRHLGQVTPAIPEPGEKVGSINALIITPDQALWYEVLLEAQRLRAVYGPGLRLGTSKPWELRIMGIGAGETGRSDPGRAEAFSDAVLAIIITLLVLDLRPPESEPGQLLSGLLQQWPTYLAYVTSYLYVGVVWLNHKAAFKRIRAIDWGLHWANLGVLFTTALLPFPTAVVADAMQDGNPADEGTAVGLYALVGALLCVSWLVFFHYLSRHPELIAEGVVEGFFPRKRSRAWAGIALYAAAGGLGYLIAPPVALGIFLALPIFYGLTSEGLYALPPVIRRS